jgi:hypothetical protein
MKTDLTSFRGAVHGLAWLALLAVLYIIVIIFSQKDLIFDKHQNLHMVEIIMVLAYFLVIVFNIISLVWLIFQLSRYDGWPFKYTSVLILGLVCMVGLFGQKVMVDEIAREAQLGWETAGEWIILTFLLALQIVYTALILTRTNFKVKTITS